jgi:hypothetical protein
MVLQAEAPKAQARGSPPSGFGVEGIEGGEARPLGQKAAAGDAVGHGRVAALQEAMTGPTVSR